MAAVLDDLLDACLSQAGCAFVVISLGRVGGCAVTYPPEMMNVRPSIFMATYKQESYTVRTGICMNSEWLHCSVRQWWQLGELY